MRQRRNRARLAFEARNRLVVVARFGGENFDRDVPPQARIAGAVHLPHSTFAQELDDFVRPDAGACREHREYCRLR